MDFDMSDFLKGAVLFALTCVILNLALTGPEKPPAAPSPSISEAEKQATANRRKQFIDKLAYLRGQLEFLDSQISQLAIQQQYLPSKAFSLGQRSRSTSSSYYFNKWLDLCYVRHYEETPTRPKPPGRKCSSMILENNFPPFERSGPTSRLKSAQPTPKDIRKLRRAGRGSRATIFASP